MGGVDWYDLYKTRLDEVIRAVSPVGRPVSYSDQNTEETMFFELLEDAPQDLIDVADRYEGARRHAERLYGMDGIYTNGIRDLMDESQGLLDERARINRRMGGMVVQDFSDPRYERMCAEVSRIDGQLRSIAKRHREKQNEMGISL